MPSITPVNFEPIKENHAIAEVVFLLDFSEPLLPRELKTILNRHQCIENKYPFFTNHVGVLTGIPSREGVFPIMSTPREVLTGIQFFNQLPFQTSTSSIFVGEGMRINYTEYKGWETNQKAALNIIKTLLNENSPIITRVSLAYRDSFIADNWSDTVDKKVSLENLLSKDSKFIPLNAFNCAYPWHSHHGFFESVQAKQYKILSNINTGLIYQGNTEVEQATHSAEVYISTEMNCIFDSMHCKCLDMDKIAEIFEDLHDRCKNVVKDLLTKDMLDRIGIEDYKLHLAD